MKVLQIRGIDVAHGHAFRLGPLDLDLPMGIMCLLGRNGAGKTTLLRTLAGMPDADAAKPVVSRDGAPLARSALRIGYMPQETVLPKSARCKDFLEYVAWLQKVPASTRDQVIAQSLEAVDLSERARSRIGSLSGGMRRRLLLSSACLGEPDLLLLDEPTVGLDPQQRMAMLEYVRDIGAGTHCLMSTHLLEDVACVADSVVLLKSGQLVRQTRMDDLLDGAETTPADPLRQWMEEE